MPTTIECEAGRGARLNKAPIRNRYYRRARLSERKFRDLLRCFSIDMSATDTARLTSVSVRSTNTVYLKIRQRIAEYAERDSIFNYLPDSNMGLSEAGNLVAQSHCNKNSSMLFGIQPAG
jgi:hypothetical protein